MDAASISDKRCVARAALKAAKIQSRPAGGFSRVRPNNHPIQDIYVREVIKEGDVFTNKLVGVALEDHGDAYAADCKM